MNLSCRNRVIGCSSLAPNPPPGVPFLGYYRCHCTVLGSAFADRQVPEAQSKRRHWCENHPVRSDTDLVLLYWLPWFQRKPYLNHLKDRVPMRRSTKMLGGDKDQYLSGKIQEGSRPSDPVKVIIKVITEGSPRGGSDSSEYFYIGPETINH